jgi:methylated-DNA-[protein]-cysteine S-methyltransferase
MKIIKTKIYKSPCGELLLGSLDNKLCLCDWRYRKMRSTIDKRIQKQLEAEYLSGQSEVIEQTITQLEEYFQSHRQVFDLPLLMVGSDFQKQVWNALIKIPFGSTTSYQELSARIGNPSAVRAVANANGANAISIIIPCHRVIGANGELTGYAGGLRAKAKLLGIEGGLADEEESPVQASLSLS